MTILGHSEPVSNGNEGVTPYYFKTPELEPRHGIQFSVIPRITLWSEVLPHCRKCSWHILSPITTFAIWATLFLFQILTLCSIGSFIRMLT